MRPLVLLPTPLAERIAARRKQHLPNETGGFLIGFRRGIHLEVTGLTEQGPGDVATATSFERRCPSHRERVHAAWRASDRFESLVGDWHSHPHGSGCGSNDDRSAWRTLAHAARQPVVGLIAAEENTPRLFLTFPSGRGAGRELKLVESGDGLFVYGARPSTWKGCMTRLGT